MNPKQCCFFMESKDQVHLPCSTLNCTKQALSSPIITSHTTKLMPTPLCPFLLLSWFISCTHFPVHVISHLAAPQWGSLRSCATVCAEIRRWARSSGGVKGCLTSWMLRVAAAWVAVFHMLASLSHINQDQNVLFLEIKQKKMTFKHRN